MNEKTDLNFLSHNLLQARQNLTEKFQDYIFCTPITSKDAVVFVTQVIPSARIKEVIISANFWSNIVLKPQKKKKILQFNAVVTTNYSALALYEKFGFVQLGTIPQGFLAKMVTICTLFPTIKIWLISSFVLIDFDTTMSRY